MNKLPREVVSVGVPPLKCQGIKTKLVPFILQSLCWTPTPSARWIEPFFGSGVVGFNLMPERALFTDTNRHIIRLYQDIQRGEVTPEGVREHLEREGQTLRERGGDFFYEVRERFNDDPKPLDFIFLNRSCFNGVMRFNSKGKFNVPFGHKPERFAKAYVTKIVNQVSWAARQMDGKEWEFRTGRWESALEEASPDDFVYLDPPYVGRHADYYNTWGVEEAERLARTVQPLPCGFALSMWMENRYRKNEHLDNHWRGLDTRVCSHFYHVGSRENLRNEMDEALVIKPGFAAPNRGKQYSNKEQSDVIQLDLALV